jgi:hypothetical protein
MKPSSFPSGMLRPLPFTNPGLIQTYIKLDSSIGRQVMTGWRSINILLEKVHLSYASSVRKRGIAIILHFLKHMAG